VDEDVGVFKNRFHAFSVRHEVRREIAFVELHTFHHFQSGCDRLGLFDSDRAVFANLIHRVGNDFADRRIPVC
jgi:hypothetical protein